MEYTLSKRFDLDELPESPELDPRNEFIKLAVSGLTYDDGQVAFQFHVSYLLPDPMVNRYQYPEEALVLVVNDVDHQDCFAANFTSDAYVPAPGTRVGSNLTGAPPQVFAPPTEEELKALSGGFVNGHVSFASPRPSSSPSIFAYIVLENYFSNVVGIDLFNQKAVYFDQEQMP
jgi:hypothetical protein